MSNSASAPVRSAPMPPAYGPLDMAHLARQTLGDWALSMEVLRIFDETAHAYAGRLSESDTRNDLMVNLNALRSAAAGVGAFALSQLVAAAEDELATGAPVDLERIADIGMAVEEVSTYITALVDDEDMAEVAGVTV